MSLENFLAKALKSVAPTPNYRGSDPIFEGNNGLPPFCVDQVSSFSEWKNHPTVREIVFRECPLCRVTWSAACDCLAAGWPPYTAGFHHPGYITTAYLNGNEYAYIGSVAPAFCDVYMPISSLPSPCYSQEDQYEPGYTEEVWYGSLDGNSGMWLSFASSMFPSNEVDQVRTTCRETPGDGCKIAIMDLFGSTKPPSVAYRALLEAPCFSNLNGACCSAAGDFGGFTCSEVENSSKCSGTFHAGKRCKDINGDNCGSAQGSADLAKLLIKTLIADKK